MSATISCPAHDPAVWERVWSQDVDPAREAAALDRERRSPRWAMIQGEVIRELGGFEDLRAVELGCGRADLSVLLAQLGAKVTLVDYSDKALASAEQRFHRLGLPARFLRADFLSDLEGLAGGFDFAASLGVIEHFAGGDRTRALAAHSAVLRPGGLAVISVPHALCVPYRLWKAYLEFRGWWPYGQEIPFTRSEFVRRAMDAGFCSARTRCFGFWQALASHAPLRRLRARREEWSVADAGLDRLLGEQLVLFARKRAVPPLLAVPP